MAAGGMFLLFVMATLAITYYSAKKAKGAAAFFAAGRSITGWQNGLAVAGDYLSAASFLGIAGMMAKSGFDGFMYSVGFLVAYLTVLFVVAEPLRNAGKYTMADLLAYRLKPRPVRAAASISTLTISLFYMIAQMIGAGTLILTLLKQIAPDAAFVANPHAYAYCVTLVGIMMVIYVVFGGMIATTYVQIIKAVLLLTGSFILSILVLKHYGFSFGEFFGAISKVTTTAKDGSSVVTDFMQPGLKFKNPLEQISLGMALLFGTAGLPHILIRFYTVPDAQTARKSVVWAMAIIGGFYILTTFFGFGAATILGPDAIKDPNMAAPLLAKHLGGEVFFAFICAVAFSTILAVVAGLTIGASTSFAHDFYTNVIHHDREVSPNQEVRVARITAFVVGALAIGLAIRMNGMNVAYLVGLAFAAAASANLPVVVLSVFWKRFNTTGAVCGLLGGLIAAVGLMLLGPDGPNALGHPFPLSNPGLVSIPIGFLAAVLGTLLTGRDMSAEGKFAELSVRSNTGLGSEKASSH